MPEGKILQLYYRRIFTKHSKDPSKHFTVIIAKVINQSNCRIKIQLLLKKIIIVNI